MPPPTVCLLGGESPLAGAALALLAQHDVQVVVGHSAAANAEAIRHLGPCAHTHACPDPHDPTEDFEEALMAWLSAERPDVALPLTLPATLALSRCAEALARWGVAAPVPPLSCLALSVDRALLWEEALRHGVPVPTHEAPRAGEDIAALARRFAGIPTLVPRHLTRPEPPVRPTTRAQIPASHAALERRTGSPPLLAEPIPGTDWHAVTVLCDAPGGVMACLGEAWIDWSPQAGHPQRRRISGERGPLELALRFLAALEWVGVATVQMKRDPRDGSLRVLQLWPGFGGGLALAASGGLDLIWPLLEWALSHPPSVPSRPAVGLEVHWEFDGVPWLFQPL